MDSKILKMNHYRFSLNRIVLLAITPLMLWACNTETSPEEPREIEVSAELVDPISAIDAEELLKHIKVLASDEFGGRAPMSEGEALTLEYMERQFHDLGLDPLFGDSYRQAVNLVSIEANAETASLSFDFNGEARDLAYTKDMVVSTAQVVESASIENSEIVFVGYGVVAPEYGWNDYKGLDAAGKTVVILVNDPGFATQNPKLFKGNAMTYYGRWTYKYEEAARQGAAAAIVIHETKPASYGWGVVANSWSGAQFHLASENGNMDRVALEAWIQRKVAQELMSRCGLDLDEMKQAALSPDFAPVTLCATADGQVDNTLIHAQSYNVGAIIKGSQRPDEAFIFTAHWDHLGTGSSEDPEEDVIYNGAVDNATGTAALLELGQAFMQRETAPARSIALLAVTAEESGLLGSKWYSEHPAIPMAKTVGGINLDAMPVYGPTKDVVVVGYNSSELEKILQAQAEKQGRYTKPEEQPQAGGYYRSDHFNFAKKGVPMLYAEAGSEHRELGREHIDALSLDYIRNRYHNVEDEVQDSWDLRGIVEDLQLLYRVALEVADSDWWPAWYDGNEFKAIREASQNAE